MKRIFEEFVEKTNAIVPFYGKKVLEIGCGGGNYSRQIARLANSLTAIDPNQSSLKEAEKVNFADNISYRSGSATELNFEDGIFDIVIFTLSLHHVPEKQMHTAIKEAARVVKEGGHIIFLEPAIDGSFFEAEIMFDACDGDEREEKRLAYKAIIETDLLNKVIELDDKTVFTFSSTEDFIESLNPKQNIEKLSDFLEKHKMTLEAKRRINICTPVK